MDSSIKYQKFVVSQGDGEKSANTRANPKCLIICGLLVVALVAAVSAVAIGVGVVVSVSKSDQASVDELSTITVTEEELEGDYYGVNGGIHFQSTVNSTYVVLSITTTSGQPVVVILHPVDSNMTIMGINDTNFMVMENQPGRAEYDDYVIPRDAMNMMKSILEGTEEMSDQVMEHLDNKTVNQTRQSVLYHLAMSPEALLIIEAAKALGDVGIQGTDYPSAMGFYLLALRLANARGSMEDNSFTLDSNTLQRRKRESCSSNCARCPFRKYNNECYGRCGYGCQCWKSVCGDCCLHQFCLSHDKCCYKKRFWSWACQSVAWKFPILRLKDRNICSKNYKC